MLNSKPRPKKSVFCPLKLRFESLEVCAYECRHKCKAYAECVSLARLIRYTELHPEYEIVGELMAKNEVVKKVKEGKLYWVIVEDNKFLEVAESEIIDNPQKFLGREIYDKPPVEYELVVALRKKSPKK